MRIRCARWLAAVCSFEKCRCSITGTYSYEYRDHTCILHTENIRYCHTVYSYIYDIQVQPGLYCTRIYRYMYEYILVYYVYWTTYTRTVRVLYSGIYVRVPCTSTVQYRYEYLYCIVNTRSTVYCMHELSVKYL